MTNDLTKGPILPALIRFTVPLIAGNLLQLTYNAVDSMIVGRYVGKEAAKYIMDNHLCFEEFLALYGKTINGINYVNEYRVREA